MNRLVEAKVELLIAIDRRNAADLEFRAALNRCHVGATCAKWAELQRERAEVSRLVREVGELEAREAGLLADFGPEEEALS